MSQAHSGRFDATPAARRNPSRSRLYLEQLESRQLLATDMWTSPSGGSSDAAAYWSSGLPTSTSDVVIGDLNPGGACHDQLDARVDPQHYGKRSGRHFRRQPHCSRRFNNERRTDHDQQNIEASGGGVTLTVSGDPSVAGRTYTPKKAPRSRCQV